MLFPTMDGRGVRGAAPVLLFICGYFLGFEIEDFEILYYVDHVCVANPWYPK